MKDEDKTVELEVSETERKQMEEELRDAQEQLIHKERLAILGQLAGGVGQRTAQPSGGDLQRRLLPQDHSPRRR